VPRPLRLLLAPLTDGLTYRRSVHLLLGAVILLPYLGLAVLLTGTVTSGGLDLLSAVLVLRGDLHAGAEAGHWRVAARLPLGRTPGRSGMMPR
jgi:hypothetical protein